MEHDITTTYRIGDTIPYRLVPSIVVFSWIVSLIGAIVTVELLHRKARSGWLSWLQLFFCAVSFGLVAIWCMHFIGNRAILLGDGRREIQLFYDGGFTTLSAILPIIFLFFGFIFSERFIGTKRGFYGSLFVTGLAAGLSITGMHYIGNFGTANYTLHNGRWYVIGAGAIAVVSCWISFTLFFHMKEEWINHFWKRMGCAFILAGAVSGMHWTATIGTSYELHSYYFGSGIDRNVHMAVAAIMGLMACIACFSLMFLTKRRRRQLADRAQHVVLASASFDPEGRLLVTQEGLLPSQKVTKQYNQRSFSDEFNVSHPVFQWLFRVTHNWPGIIDLIPSMRQHLRMTMNLRDISQAQSQAQTQPNTPPGAHSPYDEATDSDDYSTVFRELFCIAAADLASSLDTELEDLGVLYEDIMTTGTALSEQIAKREARNSLKDVESGPPILQHLFGKGQLLFVVRTVDRTECSRLMSHGYRFAQVSQVGDILARSMQVKQAELLEALQLLREYNSRREQLPAPGSHLACFALRPPVKSAMGDWDILVNKSNPCQLPMVHLSAEHLTPSQLQILARMEGFSVSQCVQHLTHRSSERTTDPGSQSEDAQFNKNVLSKIQALIEQVPEPFFRHAIFSSRPIRAQCTVSPHKGRTSFSNVNIGATAHIFAFCSIPDVHTASIKNTNTLSYTPFSFFKARQRIYPGSQDHAVLAHRNHREFGALLPTPKEPLSDSLSTLRHDSVSGVGPRHSVSSASHTGGKAIGRLWSLKQQRSQNRISKMITFDNSSEKELVDPTSRRNSLTAVNSNNGFGAFGTIMVSQDVTVDAVNQKDGARIEMRDLGTTCVAGVGNDEAPTFADELFKITSARWQKY